MKGLRGHLDDTIPVESTGECRIRVLPSQVRVSADATRYRVPLLLNHDPPTSAHSQIRVRLVSSVADGCPIFLPTQATSQKDGSCVSGRVDIAVGNEQTIQRRWGSRFEPSSCYRRNAYGLPTQGRR